MRPFGLGVQAVVWFGVLGPGACLCAQTAPAAGKPIAGTSPQDYSAEPLVIERSISVIRMKADGSGERLTTVEARVQSEAVLRQLGVITLGFAGDSERVEFVYVRVKHADGTVVETPVSQSMEMPTQVTREAPFYSDLKQKQVPVRSLRVGDTLQWQARVIQIKSEAAGQFWGSESFIKDGVVLDQQIELRVAKTSYVNVWSPDYKPERTSDGDETVYRWRNSQLKPTVGSAADAEKEAKKKHVLTSAEEVDEKEGKPPDIAWTTFKSWEQLGAWYRGLEGDRTLPDAEVKAKVAELTAGKTTQLEKVQAVYGYVATQLRYIGVAFGVGRYQPHRAADVLQNQYGDCKDKHTLLAAMLTELGLKPDAALVGVGIRFNEAVPSPQAFNHLITRVTVDEKPVWLDTTAEVAPYQMLLAQVRDHQALVIPDTGAARLERTPKNLPFAPYQKLSAVGQVDKDGQLKSQMVLTLRGDDEVLIRAVLRQASPSQYDQIVQKISEGLGYGGTVSHAEISRVEDTAAPLTIHYDYIRDKMKDWDNLWIVPQWAPVMLPRFEEKDPPLQTVTLGMLRTEGSTSEIKLPDGWTAVLPEALHARSEYATLDQTYRFEGGVVYSERKVQVLKEEVPLPEWKTYQKWTESARLNDETYVQLVRHGAASSSVKREGESLTTSTDAAKLVKEAYTAIRQKDAKTGQALLDQAAAINAEQADLWSGYGNLALLQHQTAKLSKITKKK